MAEFDVDGLSAVSAFFGVNKTSTEPVSQTSQSHTARGRHGVGSTTIKQLKTTSDDTLGRVLKVGKRKRDDYEIDENASGADMSSDEHEEEDGRTAIAGKASKAPMGETEPTLVKKPKKKKKKGKKERLAEAPVKADVKDIPSNEQQESEQANKDQDQDSKKMKRKRRKARSRQKNIYKDKRLAQHKPGHLILGRAEFQGRPLTSETRAKLNLAPSRSSRQQHDSEHSDHVHTLEKSSDGEGIKLAIDSILDEGEAQRDVDKVDVDDSNAKNRRKSNQKKRKKSKYKNLQ